MSLLGLFTERALEYLESNFGIPFVQELWHVKTQPPNLQVNADRGKAFANYISNINGAHKAKGGKALFPTSTDRGETYFVPNENTNSISPLVNSHHIIYLSHSTYYQNYPVFSQLQSPPSEKQTRESNTIDPVCGVPTSWSDHGFVYPSNRPHQLWPGQNNVWQQ